MVTVISGCCLLLPSSPCRHKNSLSDTELPCQVASLRMRAHSAGVPYQNVPAGGVGRYGAGGTNGGAAGVATGQVNVSSAANNSGATMAAARAQKLKRT